MIFFFKLNISIAICLPLTTMIDIFIILGKAFQPILKIELKI